MAPQSTRPPTSKNLQQEIAVLTKQNESLVIKTDALHSDNADLKARLSELNVRAARTKHEAQQLKEEKRVLEDEKTKVEKEAGYHALKLDGLRQELVSLSKDFERALVKADQVPGLKAELRTLRTELEESRRADEARTATLEANLAELKAFRIAEKEEAEEAQQIAKERIAELERQTETLVLANQQLQEENERLKKGYTRRRR
jgi:chromosome segregation ATPase